MRAHSAALDDVLLDSHTRRLLIDVFHGPERVMEQVELTDWELDFDLSKDVKMSGSATIAYQSVAGESLVPDGTEGALSPFKARLLLTMEISNGGFVERIVLGWARLVTAPSGVDYFSDTPLGRFVVVSLVQVEFLSLEENVRRRGFRFPEQPTKLGSTYAEIRRVTGMTVVATVSDAAIPAGTTYDTGQGARLKATQMLWDNLDCIGVINTFGAWVGIPKTAGDPVATLSLGERGTVTDIGYQVDTDEIFNCVVGTFEDPNRNPIYAVAEIAVGPLSTSGVYGENTLQYNQSTPVSGQVEANRIVKSVLNDSIGGQTYQVQITCVANPVIEIGDVVTLAQWVKPLQGRLIKCRMSQGALMDVTLEVQRSLS